MAEQLGGKGNIVIIEGPTGISAAIQRNDGIEKTLEKYPDINVLHTQPADWNRDEGMSLMETWLQEGKEIDGVVAHNLVLMMQSQMQEKQARSKLSVLMQSTQQRNL